ncbi:hypothetical protein Bca101_069518 [Brassica carinata]
MFLGREIKSWRLYASPVHNRDGRREIEREESSGRTRSAWLYPLRRNREADAIKSSRRLRVPTSFGSSGRTRSAWLDPLRLIVYRHHWHERNKKAEEHVMNHDKLGLSLCSSLMIIYFKGFQQLQAMLKLQTRELSRLAHRFKTMLT